MAAPATPEAFMDNAERALRSRNTRYIFTIRWDTWMTFTNRPGWYEARGTITFDGGAHGTVHAVLDGTGMKVRVFGRVARCRLRDF